MVGVYCNDTKGKSDHIIYCPCPNQSSSESKKRCYRLHHATDVTGTLLARWRWVFLSSLLLFLLPSSSFSSSPQYLFLALLTPVQRANKSFLSGCLLSLSLSLYHLSNIILLHLYGMSRIGGSIGIEVGQYLAGARVEVWGSERTIGSDL